MTNKKLWIKVLAIVAVVCLLSCMLIACKNKEKEPTKKTETETIDVVTPLLEGVQKSIANGDMENLVASAKLDINVKSGDSSSKYTVALDVDLNLFNGSNEVSDTYFNAEITKNDTDLLLGLYYWDGSEANQGSDAFTSGTLYLQGKSGAEQKKLAITVPNVNSTMRALDAKVDFSAIDLSDEDLFGDTSTIAGIIGALLNVESETKFSLDLGALLDPTNEDGLGTLLSGLSGTFEELNLDIQGDKIAEILPEISITFAPKYASSGALTKLDLGLKVSEKDIVINKTNKEPLLIVGMSGPLSVDLGLTYNVGGNSVNDFGQLDYDSFEVASLLNVSFDATLKLNKAIALKVMDGMKINLPEGDYTLTVRLDADPTKVLGMVFSYEAATTYDANTTYFKKVNEKLYVRADGVTADNVTSFYTRKANFAIKSGAPTGEIIDGVLNIAESILGCVNSLELVLKETKTNAYPLKLIAAIDKTVTGEPLKATIQADLLTKEDGTPLLGALNDLGIKDLITSIKPVIQGLVKEDAAAATSTLKTIGQYLLGVYIGVNADAYKAELAKGVEATVDIAKIPFSGYTEFKGAFNSKYTYFTQQINYVEQNTTNGFEDGVTSYIKNADGTYSPVKDDNNEGPQAGVQYYKEGEVTYTKATGLTEFATGTKYFVAGSDIVTGDEVYGIGIKAALRVNAEEKLIIEATVKGLEVFGLPADLVVTISATGAGLFDYVVPTWAALQAKTY